MSKYLYAIHEFGQPIADILRSEGKSGWVFSTHELGSDPNDRSGFGGFGDYVRNGLTPMARLNNGYHPNGTIPLPNKYPEFAQRTANFVSASPDCNLWVIGNETNLSIERPQGVFITPQDYARCFIACRNAIKQRGAHHQVGLAAVGPWNVESGDWLAYDREVQELVAPHGAPDFLTIHTYLRSDNPYDVVSNDKMGAPYQDRYANFRAYRDTMNNIIPAYRQLPVYCTETDELPGWTDANTGVVSAMYAEIDRWNDTPGTQKIRMLALYRWPRIDKWYIEGKNGVLADFRDAVRVGYEWPANSGSGGGATPPITPPTTPPVQPAPSPEFKPEIDPKATARGVKIAYATPVPGKQRARVTKIWWLDEAEADAVGPDHHILGEVLSNGQRVDGVHLLGFYDGGELPAVSKKNPGYAYNYDVPMTGSLNEFSLKVDEGIPTDVVSGIGMGKDGNKNIHTSTVVNWELVTDPIVPVTPTPPIALPEKFQVPLLVHPVSDPNLRIMSQLWGENPAFYKRFKVDGVPLQGHNGIDFKTPIGSLVRAVAGGYVAEAAFDPSGWGNYIKLIHEPWGETLYAHLDNPFVRVGDVVSAGQEIATSGNTGVSSGPHLHFGIRVNPYNRADGWGGYSDPEIYLRNTGTPIVPGIPSGASGTIDPIVAAAIMDVESRGALSGPGGKMMIRFEPHIFADKVDANVFAQHFKTGSPVWKGDYHQFRDPKDGQWKTFHGNQELEYRAFELARALNREGAYDSTAMGAGQVMGFNAERVGYPSAEKMFSALSQSQASQIMAVSNFILSDKTLFQAVRDHDFEKVAELYNGSANIQEYAALMRAAYQKLSTT